MGSGEQFFICVFVCTWNLELHSHGMGFRAGHDHIHHIIYSLRLYRIGAHTMSIEFGVRISSADWNWMLEVLHHLGRRLHGGDTMQVLLI